MTAAVLLAQLYWLIWYTYPRSPDDVSYWLWWSYGISSICTEQDFFVIEYVDNH